MRLYLAQIIPNDKVEYSSNDSTHYITKRGNFTASEQKIILERLKNWQKNISQELNQQVELQIYVNDYYDKNDGETKRKGIYLRLSNKKAYKNLFSYKFITIEPVNWQPKGEYAKDVSLWIDRQKTYLNSLKTRTKDKTKIKAINRDLTKLKKLNYIPIETFYRDPYNFNDVNFEVLDISDRGGIYSYIDVKYRDFFEKNYPNSGNLFETLVSHWVSDCDVEYLIERDDLIPLIKTKRVRNFDLSDLGFSCLPTKPYSNFNPRSKDDLERKTDFDLHTLLLFNVNDSWTENNIRKLFEPYLTGSEPVFEWHVASNEYRSAFVIAFVKFGENSDDARMIINYHKFENHLPNDEFKSFIKSKDIDTRTSETLVNNGALQILLLDRMKKPSLITSEAYISYREKLNKTYTNKEDEVRAIVNYINEHNIQPKQTHRYQPRRNIRYRARH